MKRARAKPIVIAVNYPLAYFAERLVGTMADVRCIVPVGEVASQWNPNEEDVSELQSADLILLNGAGFASWIESVTLPPSKLSVTTRGFSNDDFIAQTGAVVHTHGPKGEADDANLVSETWLDIRLATKQIDVIREEMLKLFPQSRDQIQTNYDDLLADLEKLDGETDRVVKSLAANWIASRGCYEYFAKRYSLDLKSYDLRADEAVNSQRWKLVDQDVKERNVKAMLWHEQPNKEIQDRFDQLQVKVIVFCPLLKVPEDGDFLLIMNESIHNIAATSE
ncbi:metal ABC transporter substrate-binding protein [Novipirellula herctigrandis]|uniref:metal ABC transporter substrate-binding protein n=1 Tax=Novipirellula herctigrandis TaxID=2527986 RepID=UPI003AF3B34C